MTAKLIKKLEKLKRKSLFSPPERKFKCNLAVLMPKHKLFFRFASCKHDIIHITI